MINDLRYAIRQLIKNPGFTAVVVLTLALGIGANTAIFSAVHKVLLERLPFPEPERIVTVWENNSKDGIERDDVSPANFLDWRDRNQVFEEMATSNPYSFDFTGVGDPEKLYSALVSKGFFNILQVKPLYGRYFTDEEYEPGRNHTVVMSYGLWQRRFGADPAVIGRVLTLNGAPYTVVGILPPEFELRLHSPDRELLAPQVIDEGWRLRRRATYLKVLARLKASVSLEQAQAAMDIVARQLAEEHPRENTGIGIKVVLFNDHLVGSVRLALLTLLGAASLVLLIACANVANLLLARGIQRQPEFAVRRAVGAGTKRLIIQLLTEGTVLAVAGGAAGLLLAYWGLQLILGVSPADIPRLAGVRLNGTVLAFAVGITSVTTLLFGLAPAIQLLRGDLHDRLKESGRSATTGRAGLRTRGVVVVVEVAMAVVLLIGSGLLLRSFATVLRSKPGFETHRMVTLQQFIWRKYPNPEQRLNYVREVLDRFRNVPGVLTAAVTTSLPLVESSSNSSYPVTPEGQAELPAGQEPTAYHTVVTPEYFAALGIPLVRGQSFTDFDHADARQVVLINEAMARKFWQSADPVGKKMVVHFRRGGGRSTGGPTTFEVAGVVGNVRHQSLVDEPRPEFFQPFAQNPSGSIILVVRTKMESAKLLPILKDTVWAVDRSLPFYQTATIEGLVAESLAEQRFQTTLLALFACLALLLAAVGLYGVINFATAQRTHEFGIRIAFGAQPRDLLALVLRQGLLLASAGVVMGIGGALATTQLLRGLLYQVSPLDPLTYGAIGALLLLVAAAACLVPALRATRVDPLVALRHE
jgi:putative ABC transport system permease protein